MKTEKIVGSNTLLKCAENMLNRGEITQQQYDKMKQRNNNIPKNRRVDIVNIRE